MCEFCNNPFSTATNKDAQHIEFAGFFSSEAIDAVIRQAAQAAAATTNTVEADSDEDTSDSEDDQSESEESNDT
jgi:hypothetical protein